MYTIICFFHAHLLFLQKNNTAMHIVSTREFRANQKKFFDLAEKEIVLIARKNARPIAVSVVNEDDILTKEELQSINAGLEDIKAGRIHKKEKGESLSEFLNRAKLCIQ